MRTIVGEDIVFSTGEFAARFLPDKTRHNLVEDNWAALRDRILEKLKKEHPFLVLATRSRLISKIEERLRSAEIKYGSRSYEDSITEVGKACEGMLQILNEVSTGKTANDETMAELLSLTRSYIVDRLGERFYGDLDFIREWRNVTAHEKMKEPTEEVTIEVLRRAQLFHELFVRTITR